MCCLSTDKEAWELGVRAEDTSPLRGRLWAPFGHKRNTWLSINTLDWSWHSWSSDVTVSDHNTVTLPGCGNRPFFTKWQQAATHVFMSNVDNLPLFDGSNLNDLQSYTWGISLTQLSSLTFAKFLGSPPLFYSLKPSKSTARGYRRSSIRNRVPIPNSYVRQDLQCACEIKERYKGTRQSRPARSDDWWLK